MFYIEVLELQRNNDTGDTYRKIALYDTKYGITLLRNFTNVEEQTTISMKLKVFKVILREGMPFLRKKIDVVIGQNMTDNDLYEGFATELIKAIAVKCGFSYEIKVVDMENGKEDPTTGQWSGIIGEIVNKRADLAIGDITVTHSRKTVMDFSTPFMTLGISILYAKPHKEKAGLFSFMDPLSRHVWVHVATAFLCISITEFLLAKMTANDWENPHPCDEDPEELENIWNMHNCIWLTVGSIMQQGCDILPKGIPTRMAAAVWWFFALIVISSYTANLAAFLTKIQMEESIGSVDDLASQNQIRYGLQAGGSTEAFFKNSNYSTYQKMWSVMEKAEPSVFVKDNKE
ncbi:glutamate receptor ionotropic, kainate 2-like, partial [Sitodiplosis mosellana]